MNTSAPLLHAESAPPKKSSPNTCKCLQQHAELLGNPSLSEVRASDGADDGVLSLDKALSLVQQGMKAWQNLITCPSCPYNDDQEVLLLTFMSIRAITRYLQCLSPRYMAAPRASSLKSSDATIPQAGREDSPLTIGSFEVTGEDRMLVLRVLYQNTLQKIKCILRSLQLIQDKKKRRLFDDTSNRTAGFDDYQASSNLFHVQQISHRLVTSLQALESSLNGK